MNLTTRELLIRAKARGQVKVDLDYESLLRKMFGSSPDGVIRGPIPTQRKYLESRARNKAFKGMAGVAKTSTGVASMFLRALFQPNFRGAVGRFDYNKLLGTTYKRFEEMVNRVNPDLIIDRDKTPPAKWYIQQPIKDQNGDPCIAEIDFIGLKEYPGSYEWHRVFVDEADECDLSIVEGLKTRLRAPCAPEYAKDYGVDMAFNPPDEVHWIYPACTGLNHKGDRVQEPTFTLFEPTYGENDQNLPENYFEDNFKGLPPDLVDRLKFGKWGASFPGEAVFKDSFYTHMHVRDFIPFDERFPLIIWLDFGFRHPSCHWVQMDQYSRVRILREKLGENQEVRDFIRDVKMETNVKFPRAQKGVLYIGDPAAKQKKDTGSTLSVLGEEGVELMFLDGMSIEEGLRRVRYVLSDTAKGEPRLLISRRDCPLTVRMFQGGYYKHKTTGRPVKDGFYDHLADDIRYGITNLFEADGRPSALPDPDYLGGAGSLKVEVPDSLEYQD